MTTKMLASRRLLNKTTHKAATAVADAAAGRGHYDELSKMDVDKALLLMREGSQRAKSRAGQLLAVLLFVRTLSSGNPHTNKKIAEILGCNTRRAANIVQFARWNGYLTSSGQGVFGGVITAKAIVDAREFGLLP